MAGDWIPMRKDLAGDPAVIWMANRLEVRTEVVVGYLHKFWSWCDDQMENGECHGVSLRALGDVLALPTFPEMLVRVGWLKIDDDGEFPMLSIPNHDHWLSRSAKRRLKETRRKQVNRASPQNVRKMSASRADKSVTTEQNRTEENRSEFLVRSESDSDPETESGSESDSELRLTIDFASFEKFEADIFRDVGEPTAPNHRKLASDAARLACTKYSQNWLYDSLEAVKVKRPTKPYAYLLTCLRNKANKQGWDFDRDR